MRKLSFKNYFYLLFATSVTVAIVITSFFLTEKSKKQYTSTSSLMNKKLHQVIYGKDCEEILEIVKKESSKIEETLSFDFYGSDIEKINNSGGKWVKVSDITINTLQKLINISYHTGGIFKPFYINKNDEDANKIKKLDCNMIIIDKENNRVRIENKGVILSVDELIEGIICNKAIEIYKSKRINRAIIKVGSTTGYLNSNEDNIKNGFVSKCSEKYITDFKTGKLTENRTNFEFYHPNDAVISCALSRVCSILDNQNAQKIVDFFT